MEIKILCDCGVKFKFDVEPAHGRSPGPVRCPGCGLDRTDATNAIIHERLHAAPAAPTPVAAVPPPAIVIPAAAHPAAVPAAAMKVSLPTPAAPQAHAAPPPPASPAPPAEAKQGIGPRVTVMAVPTSGGTALSVSGGHGKKEEKPAEASASAPPPEPAHAHPATAKMAQSTPARASGGLRMGFGITGAVLGGLVGMIIWYFVVITSGREMKLLAILVGVCAGWGARLLGGGRHDKFATAAGVSATIAILAGQFLSITFITAEAIDLIVDLRYTARMAVAKEAQAAKTDPQVRQVMTKNPEGEFAAKRPEEITEEEIARFRQKEFPALVKFANGTPTRTQFETETRKVIEESGEAKYEFQMVTILWILAGIAAAWKISKPPSKD